MNTKRKIKMKAFCKLTATVLIDDQNKIAEILDIDEVEEIINIIY